MILRLDDPRAADAKLSGGKGASLARMMRAGLPVPPGFVVPAPALEPLFDLEARVMSRPPPADLAEAIRAAYEGLGGGAVAVRSSALAEDSASASFAGQQDTYLDVIGAEAVLEKVRACAASLFNERALAYRAHTNQWEFGIAVVVQRMVDARAAGVLFTRDPVRRSDRVVVEAVAGSGEQLVSGEAVPDHYEVDRATGVVSSQRVPRARVLSDDDLRRVVELGLRCEELFGAPQDVEWAISDQLYLLQSRPITTC